MPTFITRRTALAVTAAAALASLTACASDIRPLEDPSVVDPMRPYKGELKFNSYKSTGTYRPASATEKAENPPMPVPPQNMKSKTTSGMYAAVGYWVASLNYMAITGDPKPLKVVDLDGIYVQKMKSYVELYAKGEGWMYGTETPLMAELTEETPQKVDEQQYRWLGVGRYNKEAKIHYTDGRELTMASLSSGPGDYEFFFILEYQDGAWTVWNEPTKLTTSSPSSSGSNSGASV